MNNEVPVYTTIVDRNGNSYPTGGCQIVPTCESDHDNIWSFNLQLIAPNGSKVTIANGGSDWGWKRPAPEQMVEDRDRVNEAIKNGERFFDLRDEVATKAT